METLFALRKIVWIADKMRKEILQDFGKPCKKFVKTCPSCDQWLLLLALEKIVKEFTYLIDEKLARKEVNKYFKL